MVLMIRKIGLGGGCHWCTEAVFDSLRGVTIVLQGWIKSTGSNDSYSEAIIVEFDDQILPFETLIEVHLLTHSSTNDHSMREKYRSAVYFMLDKDEELARKALEKLSTVNKKQYITEILPFEDFKLNSKEFLDYYKTRPDSPFCQRHIEPKLLIIKELYGKQVKGEV